MRKVKIDYEKLRKEAEGISVEYRKEMEGILEDCLMKEGIVITKEEVERIVLEGLLNSREEDERLQKLVEEISEGAVRMGERIGEALAMDEGCVIVKEEVEK